MTTSDRFGLFAAVGMAGLSIFGGALSGCAASNAAPAKSVESPMTNEVASIGDKEEAPASPAPDEQLSAATIQAVVRGSFDRFQACYEEGLARDPKLTGRVLVRFVITNSGRLQNPELVEGPPSEKLNDQQVLDCILDGYRHIEFPAFESGEMTIVYPILFSPEPPPSSDGGASTP